MKTRNRIIGMVLAKMLCILAAIITLSLFACKEDEPDPKCVCTAGTEHLFGQPCCEGTGCKCQIYYGVLPNGVKIYKGEGAEITDEQMTTAVQNAIEGYNAIDIVGYGSPDGKFSKVFIISDKTYSWNGSILGLKFDLTSAQIRNRFERIAEGNLEKA